jgi:hypothetical protein
MNPTLLSLQQPSLASNAPQGSSAVPIPKRPNLHPPDQERHLNVEVFTSSNLDLINSYSENFPPIDTAGVRSIKQGILVTITPILTLTQVLYCQSPR